MLIKIRRREMQILLALLSMALIGSCAGMIDGKIDVVRPTTPQTVSNFRIIDKPREAVWNSSVPELGKQFFVINNLDKSSGLINLSYSGDPERYVDCGRLISYVKNARGERTYDFPASRAQYSYEVLNERGYFFVERKMLLEGRVNLVFEENGANSTRVTANTRYVVNKQVVTRNPLDNVPRTYSESIAFNTGGRAAFPDIQGQAVECVSTGELEREILSFIK
jgi:hypothetical protein